MTNRETPQNLALFLLIGQSNMAGRGVVEAQDRAPIAGVWKFESDAPWVPAVDPLHFDKLNAGVGLARSFARTLRASAPQIEIGLIPCAVGGTSLDQWQPGEQLFNAAVARGRKAMARGKLQGILWHQGESDSKTEATALTYTARWSKMISALRQELGAPDLPVLVGGLGEFLFTRADHEYPFAKEIHRQLSALADPRQQIRFVDSANLADGGDQLHFSAAALREFGERYAREFLKLEPTWMDQNR